MVLSHRLYDTVKNIDKSLVSVVFVQLVDIPLYAPYVYVLPTLMMHTTEHQPAVANFCQCFSLQFLPYLGLDH